MQGVRHTANKVHPSSKHPTAEYNAGATRLLNGKCESRQFREFRDVQDLAETRLEKAVWWTISKQACWWAKCHSSFGDEVERQAEKQTFWVHRQKPEFNQLRRIWLFSKAESDACGWQTRSIEVNVCLARWAERLRSQQPERRAFVSCTEDVLSSH